MAPGAEDSDNAEAGTVTCLYTECRQGRTSPISKYQAVFLEQCPVVCNTCGWHTCVICQKPYKTLSGLSIHLRSKHAVQYHQAAVPVVHHQRWNYDTLSELARVELSLPAGTKNINQQIRGQLPQYTIEQIKGARNKNKEYKNILEDLLLARSTTTDQDHQEGPAPSDTIPAHTAIEWQHITSKLPLSCDPAACLTSQWLIDWSFAACFPPMWTPRATVRSRPPAPVTETGRRARRRQYKETQQSFRKSKKTAVSNILNGDFTSAKTPLPPGTEAFWKDLFGTPSIPDTRKLGKRSNPLTETVAAITEEEVVNIIKKKASGSPGPDGWTWKLLKNTNKRVLLSFLNLWLAAGKIPSRLCEGVTTMLPKEVGTQDPANFRPITVSSVFIRLHHCILGSRLERFLPISTRQKGFRRGDGLYFNSLALQKIITTARSECRNLRLAFVDVSKAFDSVSHPTLWKACRWIGIPDHLVEYLRQYYLNSWTRLRLNNNTMSERIYAGRGIKQGDPLSVYLFNTVIELVTTKLDTNIGYNITKSEKITYMAYADDIILLSSTDSGLKTNFSVLESELKLCGLNINAKKSATLNISVHGRDRKWVCNPSPLLKVDDTSIPSLNIKDTYKYLGCRIGALGANQTPDEYLTRSLENITKAPLKPQQRLYILREHLVPKMLHQLVLAGTKPRALKHLDFIIRSSVKQWLKVKIAPSNADIYAAVKDGGLGIPSLRYLVPVHRHNRTTRLLQYDDPLTATILEGHSLASPIISGEPISSTSDIDTVHRNKLTSEVNGRGLRYHQEVPQCHRWVREPTTLLTGKDYIRVLHLRFNLMLSNILKHRLNKNTNINCPVCVNSVHSTAHVLQICPRTHGPRIQRHNAVAKLLHNDLLAKGFALDWEPLFKIATGNLKPDIIARIAEEAYILDVSIISDNYDLEEAYANKVNKYSGGDLLSQVRERYNVAEVIVGAVILNWRGAMATSTYNLIANMTGTTKVALYSVRTLQYGLYIWDSWHKSTCVQTADILDTG